MTFMFCQLPSCAAVRTHFTPKYTSLSLCLVSSFAHWVFIASTRLLAEQQFSAHLICCLRNVLHIIWNWRNCCRFVLVQHWDKCLALESFSFSTPLSSSQLSSQWSKVCFCSCLSCQCVCFVLPCCFSGEDNIEVNPDKPGKKKKELFGKALLGEAASNLGDPCVKWPSVPWSGDRVCTQAWAVKPFYWDDRWISQAEMCVPLWHLKCEFSQTKETRQPLFFPAKFTS